MSIENHLAYIMADRKVRLKDLAEMTGISNVNLSRMKTHKSRSVRFSTLDALCEALECQPGDLLEYKKDEGQDIT